MLNLLGVRYSEVMAVSVWLHCEILLQYRRSDSVTLKWCSARKISGIRSPTGMISFLVHIFRITCSRYS